MRKFGDSDSLMTLDTNDTNDTHFCQRNQEKCDKSRLITTSAPKHFIPKVAYFYPKSGVVLGASIYVKPPPAPPKGGEFRVQKRLILFSLLSPLSSFLSPLSSLNFFNQKK